MEENPYRSPAASSVGAADSSRFRRRLIPAGFSWFAASMLFVGGLLGSYRIAVTLMTDPQFWPAAAGWLFAMFGASALNFWAGRSWMERRWLSALALNIGSCCLYLGVMAVSYWYSISG